VFAAVSYSTNVLQCNTPATFFFADPRTNEYVTKAGLLVTTIEYFDLILSIPSTYLCFQLKILCLVFVSPFRSGLQRRYDGHVR
jgi:hypothetical protein